MAQVAFLCLFVLCCGAWATSCDGETCPVLQTPHGDKGDGLVQQTSLLAKTEMVDEGDNLKKKVEKLAAQVDAQKKEMDALAAELSDTKQDLATTKAALAALKDRDQPPEDHDHAHAEHSFCRSTGVHNAEWGLTLSDEDCHNDCHAEDGICESGGELEANCKCTTADAEAKAACAGKSDGDSCIFQIEDSPDAVKLDDGRTKKKSWRWRFQSKCEKSMCYPHHALSCLVNGEWQPEGSVCVHHKGETTSGFNPEKQFSSEGKRTTYSLSKCIPRKRMPGQMDCKFVTSSLK